MKKMLLLAALSLMFALAGAEKKSALVLYYSWSDSANTKRVAEHIAKEQGAAIERIVPEKLYSRKYNEVLKEARAELKENRSRSVKALKNDLKKFDVIFIGSPIWFGTYAPPVRSFMQQYDLSGKKLYFFCTHGKGGPGVFFKDMGKLAPESVIGKGFSCYGTHVAKIAPKVKEWLNKDVK